MWKKRQTEIEQGAGDRLAIDGDVRLGQMPAARARHQHRRAVRQAKLFAAVGIGEAQLIVPAIADIDLAVDQVLPGRRRAILEIGHIDAAIGVEPFDQLAPLERPGHLDATIDDLLGDRRNTPVAGADFGRLRQEVRQVAGIEALLAQIAQLDEITASRIETAMQGRPGSRALPA